MNVDNLQGALEQKLTGNFLAIGERWELREQALFSFKRAEVKKKRVGP